MISNSAPAVTSCDVILTDAGNEVGYQVLRLLSKAGFRVIACDRNPSSLKRHLRYAAGVRRTLAAQDERNFVRQVRRLEQESGARIIIPVFYAEVLSRHRDEFDAVIPVASSETLNMLDDKLRACNLAASLGILQPRMYSSPDEVDRFPVVFKRTTGHSGDSVYFPKTREPLEHLVDNSEPGTWLISEEIDGFDASVDVIRWKGLILASAYQVLYPKAKGISIIRRSIEAPGLIGIARKMLDAVDYEGVCGFDFRVAPDGEVYFLECNPRFTGGICSSAASGLNLPVLLCRLALGNCSQSQNPDSHIRTGIVTVDWRELLRRTVQKIRHRRKRTRLALPRLTRV